MDYILISDITITQRQRFLRRAKIEHLKAKMLSSGYNVSYPITITKDKELVDGGHRVESARLAGINRIPYIVFDGDPVQHMIRCNEDGTDTDRYDVFDYAELCWTLAKEMDDDIVGKKIGWKRVPVIQHKSIKTGLHSLAWNTARSSVTKKSSFVTEDDDGVVTENVTNVTWKEGHFRAFLKALPYTNGNTNRATARAQVAAIRELMMPPKTLKEKLTADRAGKVATKWAWWRKLLRDGFARLSPDVGYTDKRNVIKNVKSGKFGENEDNTIYARFIDYIDSLNAQVVHLDLYHGDAGDLFFLGNETIDLIITSPPYNLGNGKVIDKPLGAGYRHGVEYSNHNDAMPQDEYIAWQLAVFKELYRVAKPGASFFYNHKQRTIEGKVISPQRWIDSEDNPWVWRQEIVWNRLSTINMPTQLFWQYDERIYWMTKGKPILPDQSIGTSTVWEKKPNHPDAAHPAPFPLELPTMLLDALNVAPGTVVLDPFAGSCTTVAVALKFECKPVGVDISRTYLEDACTLHKWSTIHIHDGLSIGDKNVSND